MNYYLNKIIDDPKGREFISSNFFVEQFIVDHIACFSIGLWKFVAFLITPEMRNASNCSGDFLLKFGIDS